MPTISGNLDEELLLAAVGEVPSVAAAPGAAAPVLAPDEALFGFSAGLPVIAGPPSGLALLDGSDVPSAASGVDSRR
jgi:hypothetical protein